MSEMDILKSYLVSLGFQTDNKSFNETNKAIDSVGKEAENMAGKAVGNFLKAGAGITTFVATAVTGIAKYISGLGQAQIKNEIFARQMWTSQESAWALNNTLKAMGVTLQDLYLSPTLMSQFQQLNAEARTLQAPSEYKDQMKFIQSITFEFTRMKLEATYSLQWIGYYFVKYMAGPLGQVKNALDYVNNIIVKTMPQWTRNIAIGLVDIVKFGQTIFWALTQVGAFLKNLSDMIPAQIKVIVGALLLLSSPITAIISGILLLQDYLTFKNGGKSVFSGLWQDLSKFDITSKLGDIKKSINNFWSDLEKNGVGKNFEDALNKTLNAVKVTGKGVAQWFNDLTSSLNKDGILEKIITDFSKLIDDMAKFIDDFVKNKDVQAFFNAFGKALATTLQITLDTVDKLIKGLSNVFNAMDDVTKGDFKSAKNAILGLDKNGKAASSGSSDSTFNKMSRERGFLMPQSYIYPQANSTTNHVTNTLNQTNHIYGSNTTNAAGIIDLSTKNIIRNWQEVQI